MATAHMRATRHKRKEAAHLASGILAATMRVASVENPAAQAPLAAKLYFDCHDALRAERKRRYEV